MRILILGGTVFLGRALTDAALARGHEVTHCHRGRSAGCDPRVETLICDREQAPYLPGVDPARTWDAVVDTCGYLPQTVSRSCEALRDRAGMYAFVSSISVYASFENEGYDEDAPLQPDPDPLPDKWSDELYGALKAACEREVVRMFGNRALVVRPGLLVGPHDPTDRFTWWPWRVESGGTIAAPGRPHRAVQFIDVRDVADWMIAMLEQSNCGCYQATGHPLPMVELLGACSQTHGTDALIEWIPDEFLLAHHVGPWMEMPLWLPESEAAHRGFMKASVARAVNHGLRFRPLAQTVADTLAWARTRSSDHRWKAGLPPARETALLDAWRHRR